MSYDLRRLRLHGLIERVPKSHRYHVTELGFRTALFLSRSYNRLLRPGLSAIGPAPPPAEAPSRRALEGVDKAIDQACRSSVGEPDDLPGFEDGVFAHQALTVIRWVPTNSPNALRSSLRLCGFA